MAALASPKAPSSLVKVARYSLLGLGILYGSSRHAILKSKEDARRAKEEEERPAKEAAMKAEKEKRNAEEMAYLAREVGIKTGGGGGSKGGGTGGSGGSGQYQSDCGCSY